MFRTRAAILPEAFFFNPIIKNVRKRLIPMVTMYFIWLFSFCICKCSRTVIPNHLIDHFTLIRLLFIHLFSVILFVHLSVPATRRDRFFFFLMWIRRRLRFITLSFVPCHFSNVKYVPRLSKRWEIPAEKLRSFESSRRSAQLNWRLFLCVKTLFNITKLSDRRVFFPPVLKIKENKIKSLRIKRKGILQGSQRLGCL